MVETKNAAISKAEIFIEDHGYLTAFLYLDYGGTSKGFGGYNIGCTGANYAGLFIRKCLETVGVSNWDSLRGKTIRVKAERGKVHEIGHIIQDKWFNPSEEIKRIEAAEVVSP